MKKLLKYLFAVVTLMFLISVPNTITAHATTYNMPYYPNINQGIITQGVNLIPSYNFTAAMHAVSSGSYTDTYTSQVSGINTKTVDNVEYVFFVDTAPTEYNYKLNVGAGQYTTPYKDTNKYITYDTTTANNTGYITLYYISSNKTIYVVINGDKLCCSPAYLFYGFTNLKAVMFNNKFQPYGPFMNHMFYGCKNLLSCDMSQLDTSQITDMSYMFYDCDALTYIDFTLNNLQYLAQTSYMFNGCAHLALVNFSGCDMHNFGYGVDTATSHVDTNNSGSYNQTYSITNRTGSKTGYNGYSTWNPSGNTSYWNFSGWHNTIWTWVYYFTNNSTWGNYANVYRYAPNPINYCLYSYSSGVSNSTIANDVYYNTTNYASSACNTPAWNEGTHYFTKLDTWLSKNNAKSKPSCSSQTTGNATSTGTTYVAACQSSYLYTCDTINWSVTAYYSRTYSVPTNSQIVTYGSYLMFADCPSLVNVDFSKANLSSCRYMHFWFSNDIGLTQINFSEANLSAMTNFGGTSYSPFYNCTSISKINFSKANLSKVTSFQGFFYDRGTTNNVNNIRDLDFSGANLSSMTLGSNFYLKDYCKQLTIFTGKGMTTTNITSLANMFQNLTSLTTVTMQNFSGTKVVNTQYMFDGCTALNTVDMSNFAFSSASNLNLDYMFQNCPKLVNLVLGTSTIESGVLDFTKSNFPTNSSYTYNTTYMFKNCDGIKSIALKGSALQQLKVTSYMFSNCDSIETVQITDTFASLSDASNMFNDCDSPMKVTINGTFSALTTAEKAFYDCDKMTEFTLAGTYPALMNAKSLAQACEKLATVQVSGTYAALTDASYAFQACPTLKTVTLTGSFANLTNASYQFQNCTKLDSVTLQTLSMPKLTNASYMFAGCTSLPAFDFTDTTVTALVTMSHMFDGDTSLKTVDMSNTLKTALTTTDYMYQNCGALTSVDMSNCSMSALNNVDYMFKGCSSGTLKINFKKSTLGNIKDLKTMFNSATGLQTLDISETTWGGASDGQSMFVTCNHLKTVNANKANFAVWNDITSAFAGVTSLESVDFSESKWTKLGVATNAFKGCTGLKTMNLSAATMDIATNFNNFLDGCTSLKTLNMKNFSCPKGVYYNYFANNCSSLDELTLTGFKTATTSVEFANMFSNCSAMPSYDFSDTQIGRLAQIHDMFAGNSSMIEINLEGLDTSYVSNYNNLFKDCTSVLNIDATSFDTMYGITYDKMFDGCSALMLIDISSFNMLSTSSTTAIDMLSGVTSLQKIKLPTYPLGKQFTINFPYTMYKIEDGYTKFEGKEPFTSSSVTLYAAKGVNGDVATLMSGQKINEILKQFINPTATYESNDNTVKSFTVSSVKPTNYTSSAIVGVDATLYYNSDTKSATIHSSADTVYASTGTMSYLFYNLKALNSVNLGTLIDTTSVDSLAYMFYNCASLTDFTFPSNFDSAAVKDTTHMYTGCAMPLVDISSLDLSALETPDDMFSGMVGLYGIHLPKYPTGSELEIAFAEPMYHGTTELASYKAVAPFTEDACWVYVTPGITTNNSSILLGNKDFTKVIKQFVNPSAAYNTTDETIKKVIFAATAPTNTSNMKNVGFNFKAYYDSETNYITVVPTYPSYSFIKPNSFEYMFYNMKALEEVDLTQIDMSPAKTASYMFYGCSKLTGIIFGKGSTSKMTDISYMFKDCTNLQSQSLAKLRLDSVTNTAEAMSGMQSLYAVEMPVYPSGADFEITLPATMYSGEKPYEKFEAKIPFTAASVWLYLTSGITSQESSILVSGSQFNATIKKFNNPEALYSSPDTTVKHIIFVTEAPHVATTAAVGFNFTAYYDTATDTVYVVPSYEEESFIKPDSLQFMFYNFQALEDVDMSSVSITPATTMSYMFDGCQSLTKIIWGSGTTENITDLSHTFYNCQSIIDLDLSELKLDSVRTATDTFIGMKYLFHLITPTYPAGATFRTKFTIPMYYGDVKYDYYDNSDDFIAEPIELYAAPDFIEEGSRLVNGQNLNAFIKKFVNPEANYKTVDSTIKTIKFVNRAPQNCDHEAEFSDDITVYYDSVDKVVYVYSSLGVIQSLTYGCQYLFYNFQELETVNFGVLDTHAARSFAYMFYNCKKLSDIDLSSLDTANVHSMANMFANCESLYSVDVASMDTTNLEDMSNMFLNCAVLDTLIISDFDLTNITNITDAFKGCYGLTSLSTPMWTSESEIVTELPQTMFDIDTNEPITEFGNTDYYIEDIHELSAYENNTGITTLPNGKYFNTTIKRFINEYASHLTEDTSIKVIEFTKTKPKDFTDRKILSSLLSIYYNKPTGTVYVVSSRGKFYLNSDPSYMFSDLISLTDINFNNCVSTFRVKTFDYMFNNCSSLKSLTLASFNAPPRSIDHMFYNCTSLESLDFEALDMSKITDMSYLFYGCSSLSNINISATDFSNVEDMSHMFYGCSALTSMDFSTIELTKVTSMEKMFYHCASLTGVDLSSTKTDSLINIKNIFESCENLQTVNMDDMNLSGITSLDFAFAGCSNLQSVSFVDTNLDSVKSLDHTFYNCSALTEFDTAVFGDAAITNMNATFSHCKNLLGLDFSNLTLSGLVNADDLLMDAGAIETLNMPKYPTGATFTITLPSPMYNAGSTSTKSYSLYSNAAPFKTKAINLTVYMPSTSGANLVTGITFNTYLKRLVDPSATSDSVDTKIKHIIFTDEEPAEYTKSVVISNASSDVKGTAYYIANSGIVYLYSEDEGFIGHSNSSYMFYNMQALESVAFKNLFDTKYVNNMSNMFMNCYALSSLELGTFDLAKVTTASNMFKACYKLETLGVPVHNGPNSLVIKLPMKMKRENDDTVYSIYSAEAPFINSAVTLHSAGLQEDYALLLDGTDFNEAVKQLVSSVAGVNSLDGKIEYITFCNELNDTYTKSVQVSKDESDAMITAYYNPYNATVYVQTNAKKVRLAENSSYIFNKFGILAQVNFNDLVDFSAVTSLDNFFNKCYNVTSIDLSGIETPNLTTMENAFNDCSSLTYLDISDMTLPTISADSSVLDGCTSIDTLVVPKYEGDWNVDMPLPVTLYNNADSTSSFSSYVKSAPFTEDKTTLITTSKVFNSVKAEYTGDVLFIGDQINRSNLKVTYSYTINKANGTTEDVTDELTTEYVILDNFAAKEGNNTYTISLTKYGTTKTTTLTVKGSKVEEVSRTDGYIQAEWKGEEVVQGVKINKEYMEVTHTYTITYNNHSTRIVTETLEPSVFNISPEKLSTPGENTVTVTYAVSSSVLTTTATIYASERGEMSRTFDKLEATYTGDEIIEGFFANRTDITVKYTYTIAWSDGTFEQVTDYINDFVVDLDAPIEVGDNIIPVSYTDINNITKTANVTIPGVAKTEVSRVYDKLTASSDVSEMLEGYSLARENISATYTYTVYYNNATQKTFTEATEDFVVDLSNPIEVGRNTFEVSFEYEGITKTDTIVVTGIEKSIVRYEYNYVSASYVGPPVTEGKLINTNNVVVTYTYTIYYDNETSEIVTDSPSGAYIIEGQETPVVVGTNTFTVTYAAYGETKSTEFTVTGINKTIVSTEFKYLDVSYLGDDILAGRTIDLSKVKVVYYYQAYYDNDTDELLHSDITDFNINYDKIIEVGANEFTITYYDGVEERSAILIVNGYSVYENHRELVGLHAVYTGEDLLIGSYVNKSDIDVTCDYRVVYDDGNTEVIYGEKATDFDVDLTMPIIAGDNDYSVTLNRYDMTCTTKFIVTGIYEEEVLRTLTGIHAYYTGNVDVLKGTVITREDIKVTHDYTVYYSSGGSDDIEEEPVGNWEAELPVTLVEGDNDIEITLDKYDDTMTTTLTINALAATLTSREYIALDARYTGDPVPVGEVPSKDDIEVHVSYYAHYDNGDVALKYDLLNSDDFSLDTAHTAELYLNKYLVSYNNGETELDTIVNISGVAPDETKRTLLHASALYRGGVVPAGQTFNVEDILVLTHYSIEYTDASKSHVVYNEETSNFTISYPVVLQPGNNAIPITVNAYGETVETTCNIFYQDADVINYELASVHADYTGEELFEGSYVFIGDIKVTSTYIAYYYNGSKETFYNIPTDNYNVDLSAPIVVGDNHYAINVVQFNDSIETEVVVTGLANNETSRELLAVHANYVGPELKRGNYLSPGDLEVTHDYRVNYADSTYRTVYAEPVNNFDVDVTQPINVGANLFTVSLTKYDSTKTTEVSVDGFSENEVSREFVSVTATYNGGDIIEGLAIDANDVSVTYKYNIHYDNGETILVEDEVATDFEIDPNATIAVGSNTVSVYLTRYDVTKSARIQVTGIAKSQISTSTGYLSAEYTGDYLVEGRSVNLDDIDAKRIYTIYYNNNTEEITEESVTGFIISPNKPVAVGNNTYNVLYDYNEEVLSDTITVTAYSKSIVSTRYTGIIAEYTGSNLIKGSKVSEADIKVLYEFEATYDNDTKATLTRELDTFTCDLSKPVDIGENTYTVSYTEDNVTHTCDIYVTGYSIFEVSRELTSISAIYTGSDLSEGSYVSKNDIEVYQSYTVTYTNGSQSYVTGEQTYSFDVDLSTPIQVGTNNYTVSVTKFGTTKSTEIKVTGYNADERNRTLKSIKAVYTGDPVIEGLKASATDVHVYHTYEVEYTDNTTATITDEEIGEYTIDLNRDIQVGNNEFEVSVSKYGDTKTTKLIIPGIAKTIVSSELSYIIARYTGPDLAEGMFIDKNNIVTKAYTKTVYDNDTYDLDEADIDSESITVTPSTAIKLGNNNYTVKYLNKASTITVTGIEVSEDHRELVSIAAQYAGDDPFEGATISTEDISVTHTYIVYYNDGTSQTVYNEDVGGFTIVNPTPVVAGKNTYTVSLDKYGSTKEATLYVTGIAPSEIGRTLNSVKAKYVGEPLVAGSEVNIDDIKVYHTYTITKNDGSTEIIADEETSDFTIDLGQKVVKGANIYEVVVEKYNATMKTTVTVNGLAAEETGRELISITAKYVGNPLTVGDTVSRFDVQVRHTYKVMYTDNTFETVYNEAIDDFDVDLSTPVVEGNNSYEVSLTKYGSTKTTNLIVSGHDAKEVSRELVSIEASYVGGDIVEGLPVDSYDVRVNHTYKVTYDDGTSDTVSDVPVDDFSISSNNLYDIGENTVEVTVTLYNKTLTDTITVNVIAKEEVSRTVGYITATYLGDEIIEGSKPAHDDFNVNHIYTINYNNNTKSLENDTLTDFEITPDEPVVSGDNVYTITWVCDESNTLTATAHVTGFIKHEIARTLQSISVIYTGEDIVEGTTPSKDDITVKAIYAVDYDNNTHEILDEVITDYEMNSDLATIGVNNYTVSFTYNDVTKSAAFTVNGYEKSETSREITAIEVTYTGENITEALTVSKDDISVNYVTTIHYDNGTSETITTPTTDFEVDLSKAVAVGENTYTVTFTTDAGPITSTFVVNGIPKVETDRTLTDLRVTFTDPSALEETHILKSQLRVEANVLQTFNNGTTESGWIEIDDYDVSDLERAVAVGDNTYTITYTVNGVTKSATFTVPGVQKTEIGREFDYITPIFEPGSRTEGLMVTKDDITVNYTYSILYDNGTALSVTEKVTDYTVDLTSPIKLGENKYIVSYTADGTTGTAELVVTGVAKKEVDGTLHSISATYNGEPLVEGTHVDVKDITVMRKATVQYDNGTTAEVNEEVTNFDVEDAIIDIGRNTIKVTYSMYNQTKETTINVEGIKKSVVSTTFDSLTAKYVGPDLVEGTFVSPSDWAATATYTVHYNNGTTAQTSEIVPDAVADLSVPIVQGANTYTVTYSAYGAMHEAAFVVTGIAKTESGRRLDSITATYVGDIPDAYTDLDISKILVTHNYYIIYDNGEEDYIEGEAVSGFYVTPETQLEPGANTYTVSLTKYETTATTTLTVNAAELDASATVFESFTVSYIGDPLTEGMKLTTDDFKVISTCTVMYKNGTTKTITREMDTFGIENKDNVVAGKNTFGIYLTINGVTKYKELILTAEPRELESSQLKSITAKYLGKNLLIGSELTTDNFAVTATYDATFTNGTSDTIKLPVKDFSFTPDYIVEEGDNEILIVYSEDDIEVETTVHVKGYERALKNAVLDSIDARYTGGDLQEGSTVPASSVTVTAKYKLKYNDGTKDSLKLEVSGFVVDSTPIKSGSNSIKVTYTDEGVSKSADINVTGIARTETSRTLKDFKATYNGGSLTVGSTVSRGSVTATASYEVKYNNNTTATVDDTVTSYSDDFGRAIELGDNTYTLTFESKRATIHVTGIEKVVSNRVLESIEATYTGTDLPLGSEVNKNNIRVEGTYRVAYTDGSFGAVTEEITDFLTDLSKRIASGENTYAVSVTENNVTKVATFVVKSDDNALPVTGPTAIPTQAVTTAATTTVTKPNVNGLKPGTNIVVHESTYATNSMPRLDSSASVDPASLNTASDLEVTPGDASSADNAGNADNADNADNGYFNFEGEDVTVTPEQHESHLANGGYYQSTILGSITFAGGSSVGESLDEFAEAPASTRIPFMVTVVGVPVVGTTGFYFRRKWLALLASLFRHK